MTKLTKMVNGVSIELTPEEEAEIRAEWDKNDNEVKKTQYINDRKKEYGSVEDQLDYIYDNGIEAWKAKIADIRARHPKPTNLKI